MEIELEEGESIMFRPTEEKIGNSPFLQVVMRDGVPVVFSCQEDEKGDWQEKEMQVPQ